MSAGSPRLRVGVVGGGRSAEHDVSLASAAGVAEALETAGHDVERLTVTRGGAWVHDRRVLDLAGAVPVLAGCDVVFPVLHGPHGEDGTLAALCDLVGVPQVGSGVGAGALAMDKWATKLVAQAVGVATAPGVLLTAATATSHHWTRPVVVKPVAAGSSHGVALVREAAALPAALAAALAHDHRVLVEDVVVGREVDVAVLTRPDGSHVLPPALEVVVPSGRGVFDLAAKYDGTADLRVPASLTPAEDRALREAAVAVHEGLGCRGLARVDFFLTAAGPVLNEVNTAPGMTAQSQVPLMFAAAGTSYPALVDLLVRDAAAAAPGAAA